MSARAWLMMSAAVFCLTGSGCTPRVEVAADKPITINLNVKIDHEIRVKVDKELDQVLSQDNGLF
jgi:YnbE-like lipoprotein